MTIKPIEHYPVVTLARKLYKTSRELFEKGWSRWEASQRYAEKRTYILESLFAKLLSRGGGTLIAGFPTKSCENGEG